ncbi:MAG: IspD/TarI family cytidylyltransferase [bacterium]
MPIKEYEDVNVIVVAAGDSKRFGGKIKKIFMEADKKPVIVRSVHNFTRIFKQESIIVVAAKEDMKKMRRVLDAAMLKKVRITEGGSDRCLSVLNGLLEADKERVLIHDGARCFVPEKNILEVCDSLKSGISCSAPAVRPSETARLFSGIKYELVDRERLYLMQTPQACRREEYIKLLKESVRKKIIYTDDMEYFTRNNLKVMIVEGDKRNIKITTREDLNLLEEIIKKEKNVHRNWH